MKRITEPVFRFLRKKASWVQVVAALLFVPVALLLVLFNKLPFSPPWATPLDTPGRWEVSRPEPSATSQASASIGGASFSFPRFATMEYHVKPGDTLERIASRFGLELDTISSLDRPGGRGVHNLAVGEEIKIPNQDGIFISVLDNFEALCAKYNLSPVAVLVVNSLPSEDAANGASVFFPGAKHEGYALSLSYGVAIASPLNGWLSSPFGWRADPFTGQPSFHRGIDLAAPEGSVARSASDGVVTYTGYDDILGNHVIVAAPLGFQYIYGHFDQILVKAGQRVSQGTPVGLVGATGYATGPHLHFEVWKDGVLQNPLRFLPGVR